MKDLTVIPRLETVTLPVPGMEKDRTGQDRRVIHLHTEHVSLQCATRFFEQVHCIHWLYSSEQFHTRLQATYLHKDREMPSSWLCSLYCIFALGSMGTPLLEDGAQQQPNAIEYLDMAKSLISSVCDEANLDSVRAMVLLVRQKYHMFGLQ